MKKINIDYFIDLLTQCKKDGCSDVVLKVEKKQGDKTEFIFSIVQDDNSVIISTERALQ
jgi:hypothetical protein